MAEQPVSQGAVRARPGGDPRRGQLAGPVVPIGRRPSLLRGPRRGGVRLGRRREPASRLRPVLRGLHPRPRPSGRGRCGERRGLAGDDLRRPHRGGGAAGRGHLCAGRGVPTGAPGLLGHRSGHERGAGGAGLHRPVPDREVRRLLPRPLRRPAGRRWQRGGHPRPPRLGRGASRRGGRHGGGPLQPGPRARRSGGLRHRRGGGGQHGTGGARPGVPRRAPCRL